MWDSALTGAEISTIYSNGLAGIGVPEPGTSLLGLIGCAVLLLRRSRRK